MKMKRSIDKKFKKDFKENEEQLYTFLYVSLNQDRDYIKDIMQETFIVYYNIISEGKSIEIVLPYLKKVAMNIHKIINAKWNTGIQKV
jgi:DNA-directed RNA polymerase specialized sigma24 family protein